MPHADKCGFLLGKMDGLLVGRLAGCPYGRLAIVFLCMKHYPSMFLRPYWAFRF